MTTTATFKDTTASSARCTSVLFDVASCDPCSCGPAQRSADGAALTWQPLRGRLQPLALARLRGSVRGQALAYVLRLAHVQLLLPRPGGDTHTRKGETRTRNHYRQTNYFACPVAVSCVASIIDAKARPLEAHGRRRKSEAREHVPRYTCTVSLHHVCWHSPGWLYGGLACANRQQGPHGSCSCRQPTARARPGGTRALSTAAAIEQGPSQPRSE